MWPMQSVQNLITDPSIPSFNKLRLVLLYSLRYQKSSLANVAGLISALVENGVSQNEANVS